MRKDIQTINEAYESIRKPFGNATEAVLSESYTYMTSAARDTMEKFTMLDAVELEDFLNAAQAYFAEEGESEGSFYDLAELFGKAAKAWASREFYASEDEEKNVKRHSVERNTAEMRAQFTKDKSAANVRRPLVDRSVQGIKRDTYKPQSGI